MHFHRVSTSYLLVVFQLSLSIGGFPLGCALQAIVKTPRNNLIDTLLEWVCAASGYFAVWVLGKGLRQNVVLSVHRFIGRAACPSCVPWDLRASQEVGWRPTCDSPMGRTPPFAHLRPPPPVTRRRQAMVPRPWHASRTIIPGPCPANHDSWTAVHGL